MAGEQPLPQPYRCADQRLYYSLDATKPRQAVLEKFPIHPRRPSGILAARVGIPGLLHRLNQEAVPPVAIAGVDADIFQRLDAARHMADALGQQRRLGLAGGLRRDLAGDGLAHAAGDLAGLGEVTELRRDQAGGVADDEDPAVGSAAEIGGALCCPAAGLAAGFRPDQAGLPEYVGGLLGRA